MDDWIPIQSTNVKGVRYNEKEKILEIQFRKRGDIYTIKGVPLREFKSFLKSSSKGRFFWERLYKKYDVVKS